MNLSITAREVSVCEAIMFPVVLEFIAFDDLVALQLINKYVYDKVHNSKNGGYWQILCINFAKFYGLYHHCLKMDTEQAKFHLFNDLVPSRNKWLESAESNESQTFKVRTICRFRPGNSSKGKVLLPLHQFLKVRRSKLKEITDGERSSEASDAAVLNFGKQTPEEFLDPILGTIMKDPVFLSGASERIVDRAVAVQCILHGGKDPFTNEKLTKDMLIPVPDLAVRIQEYQQNEVLSDPSVDITDLKSLVEEGNEVSPVLLEALLDVQQLAAASNKLYCENRAGIHSNTTENAVDWTPNESAEPAAEDSVGEVVEGNFQPHVEMEELKPATAEEEQQLQVETESRHKKLLAKDHTKIVDVNTKNSFVSMHIPGQGVKSFHYKKVFHEKGVTTGGGRGGLSAAYNSQANVYKNSTKESVLSVMNGYNACILCYGQTGSGKTFTLFGDLNSIEKLHDKHVANHMVVSGDVAEEVLVDETCGVVLRTFLELLEAKACMKLQHIQVDIGVQFVEIYNEKATDLMTGNVVKIRRDNGEPVGAVSTNIESVRDVLSVLVAGQKRQRFAATAMNDHSSRSHTALIVTITQNSNKVAALTEAMHCSTVLYLVDLAGSERVKKSKAIGEQFKEALGINRSLLVLGKVISSLVEGKSHIPYLESKLTTLLRSAFGGNCRTNVLIHCRPDESHADETLQSMRFGERCSMILNTTKAAATSKEDTLKTIDGALNTLERQIQALRNNNKDQSETFQKLLKTSSLLTKKRKEIEML